MHNSIGKVLAYLLDLAEPARGKEKWLRDEVEHLRERLEAARIQSYKIKEREREDAKTIVYLRRKLKILGNSKFDEWIEEQK